MGLTAGVGDADTRHGDLAYTRQVLPLNWLPESKRNIRV
jgi:hypothetical protein